MLDLAAIVRKAGYRVVPVLAIFVQEIIKVTMMHKTTWNPFRSLRFAGVALAAFTLAGCVGGGAKTVESDYRLPEGERKVLAFFSVELNDQCGKKKAVVHYRPASGDSDDMRELVLDPDTKGNVPGFPQGWFFIQEEEAGDYFFSHVSYGEAHAGISRNTVRLANGRATYVGALQVSVPTCEQVAVAVSDKSGRDLPIFDGYMEYFTLRYVLKQVLR